MGPKWRIANDESEAEPRMCPTRQIVQALGKDIEDGVRVESLKGWNSNNLKTETVVLRGEIISSHAQGQKIFILTQ